MAVSILQAIILGIVQGLTEYAPVSSSGHLILVPWAFGWTIVQDPDLNKSFDVALHMGTLLGGTVLIEYVFNWPGLSTPLLRAVEARDYPMVVGIVLTVSSLFLLINLVMDILYAVLDPRVRAS